MAFEGLTEKLSAAFKRLRGKGRLSEADVKEAMREIRLALLEAEAGDCTLFEDSPGACRAAQAVGIRAVGVFDPFYASYEAEMRGFCDRYITSFTELL